VLRGRYSENHPDVIRLKADLGEGQARRGGAAAESPRTKTETARNQGRSHSETAAAREPAELAPHARADTR